MLRLHVRWRRPGANVEELVVELEDLQRRKVLDLARRLRPGLTLEDIANPHDFPELADADWQYEDGHARGRAERARRGARAAARGGGMMQWPLRRKRRKRGPFEALRALKEELKKKDEERKTPAGKKRPPPAAPPPRPTSAEPEDEALLLHRLFAGVQPLDRTRGSRVPKQKVERSASVERHVKRGRDAAQAEADAVHEHLRSLVEGRARFEVSDDGRRVEGRRVDLPPDALRKLRRGLLPVDGRLDLHGMGVPEARAQLELFLRTMRARGERCVLVIHGKGGHSPQGVGVLRGEIAAWLSQGASSEHVAAFATAEDADGGEGAVYVLVRR